MTYSRVIFGDNQFLGVNHSSQAKATRLYERFRNPDEILDVLGCAYSVGIRDFMFTTHDRYVPVFQEIRRSNLFPEMHFTPCIPYAHKYWNQLSERGALALLASTLLRVNPLSVVPAVAAVGFGDLRRVTRILTDIEILMCRGLNVRGVFLQNLAFDFLLSLKLYKSIEDFYCVVSERLRLLPGFITMNHAIAVDALTTKIGISMPWICANYNSAGFRMNPSKGSCCESFASNKSNNIAMSIFGGSSSADIAIEFVRSAVVRGHVKSVLFGSASKENIKGNFDSFSNF